ncbi:MAG: hypothetical protein GXP30_01305 [Verrucomicrobia bacterium]|nr:hypothetical protein [Verrucomicrobiota bacterium]
MVEELYNTNYQSSRTFTIAMWVLGIVAGGQLLAMGWAIMRHEPSGLKHTRSESGPGTSASSPPTETSNFPDGGLPPMPEIFRKQLEESTAVLPSPPLEGLGGNGGRAFSPTNPPLNELLDQTGRQAHPAHRIADPDIERLLVTGIELRASGNTQAALRTLLSADGKLPEHPRVLSEIAGTYSQMGLSDKATSYWERVYRLGENRAGAYFDMADMVLKGKQLEQIPGKDSMLSIGDIAELRDEKITAGERVTLRVTIQARPGAHPAGADMALLVYFYDLVDGKRFLPSTADTSESYISAPYDWKNGKTEAIEVTYYQPVFTPEQKRELGDRLYYGYIVELYYRDELQDVVAAPRKLRGLHSSSPPAAQGGVSGPDSSLFPQ